VSAELAVVGGAGGAGGVGRADAFAVAPYTQSEVCFHLTGALLNGTVLLAGVAWLAATWRESPPSWTWVLLAVLAGVYAADLASGLLHWAFDTWFDEDIAFLRRMVLQVREHHLFPNRIFHIRFLHDAGTLSWIALIVTAPLVLGVILFDVRVGAGPAGGFVILAATVFSVLLVTMLAFHKCGHRARQPRWIRLLQRSGLLLSVTHHSRHHLGNHDFNYCLINGWADRTLGRLGLFRALEWMVARWSGAQPQRNDHEWLRRFGRQVLGRGSGGGSGARGDHRRRTA
jgi:ubiquitin-conjugating enzyme E2 variant